MRVTLIDTLVVVLLLLYLWLVATMPGLFG